MDATNSASIRLSLESQPACVTLVRSMVSGLGEQLGLEPELIDDIKTAVSEACNNVVLHAYPAGPGPLTVELRLGPDALRIAVIDRGIGIRHVSSSSEERMGVGMAVITALADAAEFSGGPDGAASGTTVRMTFGARGRSLAAFVPPAAGLGTPPAQLAGEITLTVAPVTLLGDVLGRVTRAVAAGAHFSLDRFADLYLIVDEIAAHAQDAALGASISCAISSSSGRLELGLGSFEPGKLAVRLTGGGEGISLSRLVNAVTITPQDDGDLLQLLVIDPRRAA